MLIIKNLNLKILYLIKIKLYLQKKKNIYNLFKKLIKSLASKWRSRSNASAL